MTGKDVEIYLSFFCKLCVNVNDHDGAAEKKKIRRRMISIGVTGVWTK